MKKTMLELDQELEKKFLHFYRMATDAKVVLEANFNAFSGIARVYTGINYPFLNMVFPDNLSKSISEDVLKEQISYFADRKIPFIWFIDPKVTETSGALLEQHGFQTPGVFQGVAGSIDQGVYEGAPKGITLEKVSTQKQFSSFMSLVGSIFQMESDALEGCRKFFGECGVEDQSSMSHYIAKDKDKVVSTWTLGYGEELVTLWNGATLPEYRKRGISSALSRFALQDAKKRGLSYGGSYLMSDAMALGICNKLGLKTKWRIQPYVWMPSK